MEKYRTIIGLQKITIPRIAVLGMLLTLLIGLKYMFGFIIGIEFITFSFILLGIFLPIIDLAFLIASFNILILCLYGFGPWWIAYWIIWPIDAFVSKGISKLTKNKYMFALWGLLAGTLTFIWYYFLNLSFYGNELALLNLISALPTNIIQGVITMMALIVFAPKFVKTFNSIKRDFWPNVKDWNFALMKNRRVNTITTITLALASIITITLMFIINN